MIGREIAGRYRIQAKLGEGGMGAVFKAEQISLKRTCAVKLLRPDVAGTEMMLRRFNAEAEAVAKLSHPNTVGIYDFGQDTDGSLFIAMEFIEGKSLREAIHLEAPFSLRRALSIAVQVSASLVDAHGHSIIHRDLKPDNVMLQSRGRSRDVARVLDFGIAKLRDEGRATQAAMTQAGDMLGTPQYMAPEQIRAEQIDGRTDVYALGCMIYEMVTARLPFEAPTVMALLSKHLLENPPPPSQRRPDLGIPPVIDELIMTAIAKDPNARAPSMELFGERITAILATLPADPNVSSQQSAVVGVPTGPSMSQQAPAYTPSAMPAAAYAPQAAYGQPTPSPTGGYPGQAGSYPGQAYPTPPPPHTAPPGFAQQPSFAPGAPPYPPPATSPAAYGAPQYPPPMAPRPAGTSGSSKTLIIILAALVFVGGGIAVFFATRSGPNAVDVAARGDAGVVDDRGDDEADPKQPDRSVAAELARLQTFKTAMCACKDQACVERVQPHEVAENQYPAIEGSSDPRVKEQQAELFLAYAACMSKALGDVPDEPATPKPPKPVDLNRAIEEIADRACACTDEACARRAVGELVALATKFKGDTSGDQQRGEAAGQRLGQCAIKAGLDPQELLTTLQQIGN